MGNLQYLCLFSTSVFLETSALHMDTEQLLILQILHTSCMNNKILLIFWI